MPEIQVSLEALSTPEDLAALLGERDDAEVEQLVAELGVDATLARCFESMQARFLPERTGGQRAVVQWNLATTAGPRERHLVIAGRECSVLEGRAASPSVTINVSVPTFLRLIAGRLNGLQAFADGRVRVAGDEALALTQQTWFDVDLSHAQLDISTPSQLRKLTTGRDDEQLNAGVAITGIDSALERIFTGMVEHFLPRRAGNKRATVEFRIRTPEGERRYQFRIDGGCASYAAGGADKANVTLSVAFPDFLRMVAGQLDSLRALATGKVKVRGNLLLARKIPTWFDQSR